jgi:hypothetical protein
MKTLAIVPFILFLSACSVYKSQGRKQFESDSNGKIQAYSLQSCQKQNSISAWFQSEFPNKNYEMLVMEQDLEVWTARNSDGSIEAKAVQIDENNNRLVCIYHFSGEAVWNSYQRQFIRELENNLMTAD